MTTTAMQAQPDIGLEYAVYTFKSSEQNQVNARIWERKATHGELLAAINQADELFKTGRYLKVEIKQKYFDRKKKRNTDVTLRVWGAHRFKGIKREAVVIAVSALCGLAVFVMAYTGF